jgi:hypothetical protein
MGSSPQFDDPSGQRERDTPEYVVGVTGHRPHGLAGADHALLTTRAREVLETLRDAAGAGRLSLLSPVAEGADTLVARSAVTLGLRLRCVLPFPRDTYLRDFQSTASRSEYAALLRLAADVVELGGSTATPESRDEAYSAAGQWLIDHSDVLVAIWDGGKARGSGGTGDVINAALSAGLSILWIDSQPPHPVRMLALRDGVVHEEAFDDLSAIVADRPESA